MHASYRSDLKLSVHCAFPQVGDTAGQTYVLPTMFQHTAGNLKVIETLIVNVCSLLDF